MERRIYQDSKTAYLIIEPESDISDSLSLNMMKNNKIQCLLDMECRYVDNNLVLYYKIQGLQCMKEYIAEYNLDYNTAKQLYLDIVQAIINGEEFFLNENLYVLDLEYIYWDKKNKRAKLCCIPGWHGDFQQDIKKLAEDIIQYINHSDKISEMFIYGIYNLIADNGFTISYIKSYIKEFVPDGEPSGKHEIFNTKENQKLPEYNTGTVSGTTLEEPVKTGRTNPDAVYNGCGKITKKYMLYIDKASLPLSNYKKGRNYIYLSDICNNKKENHYEISIGRCKKCDIILPFSIISRYHAVIYITDGKFYIEDTNSSNGTYINGQKIPANVKTLCSYTDTISFAGINCHINDR